MPHINHLSGIVAILTLLTTTASLVGASEPHRMSWTVDGVEREAAVFVPESSPKEGGSPVVFAFHGHGGNMRGVARTMRYQEAWPEAIVVYMQGLPTVTPRDPEGTRPGWQHLTGDNKDRDLKFFDTVLADLRKKYTVDDKRIYATGFSNGGAFTYLLWDQRPDVFAAVAPCGGPLRESLKLATPKPAMIVAGEKDPLVDIERQKATIERVRKLNAATADGKPGEGGVTIYESEKGSPVETLIHPVAAHVLPPKAPPLIVKFFKNQALKK